MDSWGGGGTIKPHAPESVDLACEQEVIAQEVAPPSLSDAQMGWSVALVSAGTGTVDQNEQRYLVAGAPDEDDDLGGAVRVVEAEPSNGNLYTGTSSALNHTYAAQPGTQQLGWSIEVADIRDCHAASPYNPLMTEACGQEFLVGAPDNHSHLGSGEVYWYEATLDGVGAFDLGGVVSAPFGASSIAEFGTSISSWAPPVDPLVPWEVAPNEAELVVVGAPGDPAQEQVFIYEVDPTTSTPLSLVYALSPPTAQVGKGFGTVVLLADLNADGLPDLAVGAPYDNASSGFTVQGQVVVYMGNQSPPYTSGVAPFDLSSPVVLDSPFHPHSQDHFGAALAAGRIHADLNAKGHIVPRQAEGLVVGAPYADSGHGGIADYRMDDPTNPGFTLNPYRTWGSGIYGYLADGRMGASVSVGNFIAQDEFGNETTDAALLEEVAVGLPGAKDGGVADSGFVLVYLAGDTAPDYFSLASEIPPVGSVGAEFGHALASGHVQDTPWADLAIGAPRHEIVAGDDDGLAALTHTDASVSSCADLEGVWTVVDMDSNDVPVLVYSNSESTHLVFQDEFKWELSNSSGTCSMDDGDGNPIDAYLLLAENTAITLEPAYSCPGTCVPEPWYSVSFGEAIQRSLEDAGEWNKLQSWAQDGLLSTTATVWITYQEASSAPGSCNTGMDDLMQLEIEVDPVTIDLLGGFPETKTLWEWLARDDAYLEGDCEPVPNPLEGAAPEVSVCE